MPVLVSIVLTRSPCGTCAGLINRFTTDMAPNYAVTFSLSMMTLYKGETEGSIRALQNLRDRGHKLSVITVDQLVEKDLFKDDTVPPELKADFDAKAKILEAQIAKINAA